MERSEIIATLRSRADEVDAICRGLADEQLRTRPSAGEWSVLETLCHLRDTASEEGMRIRRMVEEDNPMLPLYDQDAWAIERNYAGEDLKRVLISLRVNWNGLAYMLEGFSGEDWSRPGMHPEAGATSVQPWAAGEVTHIAEHLDQIRRIRESMTFG
jgi:hypothetical protein